MCKVCLFQSPQPWKRMFWFTSASLVAISNADLSEPSRLVAAERAKTLLNPPVYSDQRGLLPPRFESVLLQKALECAYIQYTWTLSDHEWMSLRPAMVAVDEDAFKCERIVYFRNHTDICKTDEVIPWLDWDAEARGFDTRGFLTGAFTSGSSSVGTSLRFGCASFGDVGRDTTLLESAIMLARMGGSFAALGLVKGLAPSWTRRLMFKSRTVN